MLDFIKCFQVFNKMEVWWLEDRSVVKTLAIAQAGRPEFLSLAHTHGMPGGLAGPICNPALRKERLGL